MKREKMNEKTAPSLSKAEWEVIKTLWESGPLAARDVFAALPEDHGWAYKTVKTLLSRLVAKGAVDYEQIGNSYLYRAVYSREQLTRHEVQGFVERILDGSLSPILAHFVEERDLPDEEISRIREILENNNDKPKSKPGRK